MYFIGIVLNLQNPPEKPLEFVEEAACQGIPIWRLLRIICLQSALNSGLKAKVLDLYRKVIAQAYGHASALHLFELEKMGLLQCQQTNTRNYAVLRKRWDCRDGHGSGFDPGGVVLEMFTMGAQKPFLLLGGRKFFVQWSPDLTNCCGPSQLFIKPGYLLNPKFLWNNKIFGIRNQFVKTWAKLNSLNPASSVIFFPFLRNFCQFFAIFITSLSHFFDFHFHPYSKPFKFS